MNDLTSKYLVGIDLGTTHTVVAYAAVGDPDKVVQGLLQHSVQSDATSALNAVPSPFYVERAPQAPVTLQIYPSSRSQAPPAQA